MAAVLPSTGAPEPDEYAVLSVERGRLTDQRLEVEASRLGFPGLRLVSSDLYFVRGCDMGALHLIASRLLDEHLVSRAGIEPGRHDAEVDEGSDGSLVIEVALRPGVTDRVAAQLVSSCALLGIEIEAATGSRFRIAGMTADQSSRLGRLVDNLLSNPVIERWSSGAVTPGFVSRAHAGTCIGQPHASTMTDAVDIEVVPIRGLDDGRLMELNTRRGLALDPAEMRAVERHFAETERDPTDAELETIAQTWSEHCAHKTFTARIDIDGDPTTGSEGASLLSMLRSSTEEIGASFVVSAFDGNAGVVRFGGLPALAVKVETHNHPSAIEPFGGANTGVGGVVRDILGTAARPVALTDILCFGPHDLDPDAVPHGVLHPSTIAEGVVAGIADYGNKIGVPTVAGAVLYDDGYIGNPLVFCGCVGEVLQGFAHLSGPRPGDRIVVIGGATGRDGIKGATFSSMTMDASTGQVAGASVQIGDPIVERLVGEVLVELIDRERPLCTAVTDCGAGGLSSAVGEMAEHHGATVQLSEVHRKYSGLAPWEVWLSEAQERMVLAVDPADVDEVRASCTRHGVEMSDIGHFTGSQRLVVLDGHRTVVDLPMGFLHGGRPRRDMRALLRPKGPVDTVRRMVADHGSMVLELLGHPTIASKEAVIRRYDHHVLGATVVGPMSAPFQTGPSDGVVIAAPGADEGFAIGIGVNQHYGRFDTEEMAWSAVDEAVRNVVVAGADPSRIALLDNFSWGDPRRPEVLGDLVAAVRGCCDAAVAYRAPFVSGKDSLNNEFEGADGVRRSIPATLVITALAHVPSVGSVVDTTVREPGSLLVVVGPTLDELRGSHLDIVLGADHGGSVPTRVPDPVGVYADVHAAIRSGVIRSAHDVSEGGLAVCLAEIAISAAPGVGVEADLRRIHADPVVALYSESNGRLVLEIGPDSYDELASIIRAPVTVVGRTVAGDSLRVVLDDSSFELPRPVLAAAWSTQSGPA